MKLMGHLEYIRMEVTEKKSTEKLAPFRMALRGMAPIFISKQCMPGLWQVWMIKLESKNTFPELLEQHGSNYCVLHLDLIILPLLSLLRPSSHCISRECSMVYWERYKFGVRKHKYKCSCSATSQPYIITFSKSLDFAQPHFPQTNTALGLLQG